MHRFFVPPAWILDQRARLEGSTAQQIVRVLRMSPGDEILLLDDSGTEFQVRITQLARDVVEGDVLETRQGHGEPCTKITLYQAVLKGSKFDLVVQKGTELGVATFVPMICRRSIPIKQESWDRTRYPHWRKVAQEAAEQSGRSRIPSVREALSFEDACKASNGPTTSVIAWEGETATGLREALKGLDNGCINLFIGPEGGFEEQEIIHAVDCGLVPVSLGRRIMRSETAGIAATAAVLYEAGELGP